MYIQGQYCQTVVDSSLRWDKEKKIHCFTEHDNDLCERNGTWSVNSSSVDASLEQSWFAMTNFALPSCKCQYHAWPSTVLTLWCIGKWVTRIFFSSLWLVIKKKKKWFFLVAVNSTRFTTSSGLADSEEFFKTQASICLHIFLSSRNRLLHLTHEFWPLKCTVYVCFTPPPGGQEVYQKQQHDVHWI